MFRYFLFAVYEHKLLNAPVCRHSLFLFIFQDNKINN